MFYACIERKNRERIVNSSAVSRIKLDVKRTALVLEGPRNAITEYTSINDSVFFTDSDYVAQQFLLRKAVDATKIQLVFVAEAIQERTYLKFP